MTSLTISDEPTEKKRHTNENKHKRTTWKIVCISDPHHSILVGKVLINFRNFSRGSYYIIKRGFNDLS